MNQRSEQKKDCVLRPRLFGPSADTHTLYDCPKTSGLAVLSKKLSFSGSFKTYAMFKPPGNSEWVPLQLLNWGFTISATSDGQKWTQDPDAEIHIGNFENTTETPVWDLVHSGNDPWEDDAP